MKTSFLTLAFASVLSLAAFGCAASHDDGAANASEEIHASAAKSIAATTEKRFEMLDGVWNVRGIDNAAGMELAIIETGGGDPAMNGNQLFLSAYGPDHGDGGVFELGFNILTLESAKMDGADAIELIGTQSTIDEKTGDISTIPFQASVKLTLTGSNIAPSVVATAQGKETDASTIARTADEGQSFFTSIFSVKEQESKGAGNIVRLFETGGGDPAMNGDQLVLNIMSYPEAKTFDLGLNINTVSKFEATDTQVTIEGSEDYMDAQNAIKSRPFAYTVDYSIGADGAPAPAVKLTRTR